MLCVPLTTRDWGLWLIILWVSATMTSSTLTVAGTPYRRTGDAGTGRPCAGTGRESTCRAGGAGPDRRGRGEKQHIEIVAGGSSEADGWRAADQLLRCDPLPTAITTFNDHCALGVIDRLARSGVAVPEVISVAGYGNAPIAQFAAVNLTTVSQEAPIQAQWAVRAAVER